MPDKKLMPRKHVAQQRSKHTVACILEGAAHIFSQKGYAAATTNHIAQKAGVSIGSLYQYFPNKDAIVVCLAQQHLSDVGCMVDDLLAQAEKKDITIAEMIHRIVGKMIDIHMVAPRLHQAIFNEAPLPADLKQALFDYERKTARRLEKILLSSGCRPLKNRATACLLVVQLIESLSHWYALNTPENITQEEMMEEMIILIDSYINPK